MSIDRRKLMLAGLALPLMTRAALAQTKPAPKPAPKDETWDERWDRLLKEDYGHLFRYRDDNAAVIASGKPVGIVMMGDSITEGWKDKRPGFFKAGRIGRGIGGQTSPQMLVRFQPDVIALKPKAVHIMAGTNDIASNTGPMTREDSYNNFRAMTTLAQAHDIKVIIASVPPAGAFTWRPGLDVKAPIAEINHWLEGFAAENGATWVDYHPAMATADGAMKDGLSSDGVHPTEAGYDVMAKVLEPVLAGLKV